MRRGPSPSDIRAWRMLRRVIRLHGPFDIIHGHSSKAGALIRLGLPGRSPHRIYTPHAFRTMDPTLGKAGRFVYGVIEGLFGRYLSDTVICVSADEERHATDVLKIPRQRLATIVNGVATPPSGEREAIRSRLGLRPDSFAFGFIGRLSPQKAPERLIEAFRRIASQRADAELALVGFGELEEDVKIQIMEAHLSEKVHLSSEVPGAEAMQAFDALVMPSRYEAMSYVTLEAGRRRVADGAERCRRSIDGRRTRAKRVDRAQFRRSHGTGRSDARPVIPRTPSRMRRAAALRTSRFSLDQMVRETEAVYQKSTEI